MVYWLVGRITGTWPAVECLRSNSRLAGTDCWRTSKGLDGKTYRQIWATKKYIQFSPVFTPLYNVSKSLIHILCTRRWTFRHAKRIRISYSQCLKHIRTNEHHWLQGGHKTFSYFFDLATSLQCMVWSINVSIDAYYLCNTSTLYRWVHMNQSIK